MFHFSVAFMPGIFLPNKYLASFAPGATQNACKVRTKCPLFLSYFIISYGVCKNT
jgi:hypothetical protein